jgi:periplasmic protein TonB
MERYYALPIAFAAAFHAALLFGFSKPPPAVKPVVKTHYTPVDIAPPIVEEPVAVVDGGERSTQPKEVIERLPPTQPEPPPVLTDSNFVVRPPPVQPGVVVDTDALIPPVKQGLGGGGWSNIIPVDFLDKSPRTRFQPAPNYPWDAKGRGDQGEVIVEFRVDEQGHVRDPRVISSTNRVFEEPTLRAVSRWVFEPGRRDGKVVSFRMSVPVSFKLNE